MFLSAKHTFLLEEGAVRGGKGPSVSKASPDATAAALSEACASELYARGQTAY